MINSNDLAILVGSGVCDLPFQYLIIIYFIYTLFSEKKLCSRVFTAVHSLAIIQTKDIINDDKR